MAFSVAFYAGYSENTMTIFGRFSPTSAMENLQKAKNLPFGLFSTKAVLKVTYLKMLLLLSTKIRWKFVEVINAALYEMILVPFFVNKYFISQG